jgi:hypothetical protein
MRPGRLVGMQSFTEPIVAVTLSLSEHTGLTLYAPPWEDTDGEEWQGLLGDGAKIVLLGDADELHDWLAANPDHDLADHPAWAAFAKRGKKALTPVAAYDFDAVYELAAEDPAEDNVTGLADTIDMASRIADCCEDGALRSLLNNTREYRLVTEDDVDYISKEGRGEWSRLGDVIADSWPRATARLETWFSWQGSSAESSGGDSD